MANEIVSHAADLKGLAVAACKLFESSREENPSLSIAQFLKDSEQYQVLDGHQRRKMLTMLLKAHIDVERRNGRSIDAVEFSRQFPDFDEQFFRDLIMLPEMPPPAKLTPQLPEKYEIVDEAGQGGIGIVYRVIDHQMKRKLAIKMVNPKRRGDWMADLRLQQEAVITGSLQHPGIPPIYERGKLTNGGDFYSMKLVEGKTLGVLLNAKLDKRHSLIEMLDIFRQITQTIGYAHAQGVIHRDLKPQNVMVGAFGEVQVMDWGMAKRLSAVEATMANPVKPEVDSDVAVTICDDQSLFQTRQGDIAGTPAFMSPEQARGDSAATGRASDVFSLGVILFEILTGRSLHADTNGSATALERVAQGEFLGHAKSVLARSGVDQELVDICLDSLQPEVTQRLTDAGVLQERVNDYLTKFQERLKQAEIETSSAKVKNIEQRKRTWAIAILSGIVAVVSVVGMLAFAQQSFRANQSAVLADKELETRKEINEFLLDFFRQANPYEQPDRRLTVREMLDRAAATINSRFKDRPLVRGEIHLQLARSYGGLGEYKLAYDQAQQGYGLLSENLAADNHGVWEAETVLANMESKSGDHDRAQMRLEKLIKKSLVRFGENSEETMSLQAHLSMVLNRQGKYQQAESTIRDVVERESKLNALDNRPPLPSQIVNRIRLAGLEMELGRYVEAIDQLENVLKVINEQIDPRRIKFDMEAAQLDWAGAYLDARAAYALALDYQYRFDEAEPVHAEVLAISKELYGESHAGTIGLAANLSSCMLKRNEVQNAKPIIADAIEKSIKKLGTTSDTTINLQNLMASACLMEENYDAAEELFKRLEEVLAEKHDTIHPDQVTNSNNLASVYTKTGRFQMAIDLLLETLGNCEHVYGEEHPLTAITYANLAYSYRNVSDLENAERAYLTSIRISDSVLSENHDDTLLTISDLSVFYMQQEALEKAVPWLQRLRAGHEMNRGSNSEKTVQAALGLAVTLAKLDRHDEAAAPFAVVYQYYKNKFGIGSKRSIDMFFKMAKNLYDAKRSQELFEVYDTILNEFKQANLSGTRIEWTALRFRSRRARELITLGQVDEGIKELTEVFELQEQFKGVEERDYRKLLRATASRLIKAYQKRDDEAMVEQWKAAYDQYREPKTKK